MSEYRCIAVTKVGDAARVILNDPKIIDSGDIKALGDELSSLVDKDKIRNIVLSLETVDFLSSAGLNTLILFDTKVKQAGGKLRLCNLRAELREVFRITRLNHLFFIEGDRRDDDDDDDIEWWGAWVPKPTPPVSFDGRAEPPNK